MKTTIDRNGCIQLDKEMQNQLGLKPGDEVIVEPRGHEWVISAAKLSSGLSREGNVLVHRGVSPTAVDTMLASVRNERDEQLTRGK